MLIQNHIYIIVVFNYESVFENNQIEIYVLPYGGHLIKHSFDLKLFGCLFTYFNTEINVSH